MWKRWTMSHDPASDALRRNRSGRVHRPPARCSEQRAAGLSRGRGGRTGGNDGHGYLARSAGRCRRVLDQSSRHRQVAAHRLVCPDHRQPDCRSAGRVVVRRPEPVHACVRRIGDGDGGCLPARRERGEQADQRRRHVDGRDPAVPAPAVSARIPLRGRASGHRRLVVRARSTGWGGRPPQPSPDCRYRTGVLHLVQHAPAAEAAGARRRAHYCRRHGYALCDHRRRVADHRQSTRLRLHRGLGSSRQPILRPAGPCGSNSQSRHGRAVVDLIAIRRQRIRRCASPHAPAPTR